MTSGLTASAALPQASTRAGQSSSENATPAPIAPPVVRPRWQTTMSAPTSAIAAASSSLNTYGVVSRSFSRARRTSSTSRP